MLGASKPVISEEAKNFFASGRAYNDALKPLVNLLEDEERQYLILPSHTLIGISIETLFKAVLNQKGVPSRELKDVALRHNLAGLRDRAKAEGFVSKSRVNEIIDHISETYGKHEYRYMKVGGVMNKVKIGPAISEIEKLIEEVRDFLGL